MGIRSLSTASISTGTKRSKVWDQSAVYSPSSFESIATLTGSGTPTSVTFSSIPSTYKHLQVRFFGRLSGTSRFQMRFNGDSGNNYSVHAILAGGTSIYGIAGTPSGTSLSLGYTDGDPYIFCSNVVDILDYANTSKYKTTRALTGFDKNTATSGEVGLWSGLWLNTAAISSITLVSNNGATIDANSSFALYGIKG